MDRKNRRPSRVSRKNGLSQSDRRKVDDYLQYLQTRGLSIQRAYVFGSRVRGKTHRWSDIDVCVISPDFGPRNDGISYLWRALRKTDVSAGIEPVGFHPNDFIEDVPLVCEILKYGLRVI